MQMYILYIDMQMYVLQNKYNIEAIKLMKLEREKEKMRDE